MDRDFEGTNFKLEAEKGFLDEEGKAVAALLTLRFIAFLPNCYLSICHFFSTAFRRLKTRHKAAGRKQAGNKKSNVIKSHFAECGKCRGRPPQARIVLPQKTRSISFRICKKYWIGFILIMIEREREKMWGPGANVVNKFQSRNKALWLVKNSHGTLKIQSESYDTLKFAHDIGSRFTSRHFVPRILHFKAIIVALNWNGDGLQNLLPFVSCWLSHSCNILGG